MNYVMKDTHVFQCSGKHYTGALTLFMNEKKNEKKAPTTTYTTIRINSC